MNTMRMRSLLTRHGTPKTKLEAFGELILGNREKWRLHAMRCGALESEADDVVSDSLTYLCSRPELNLTERMMSVTVKCRAKNCARARGNTPIGSVEDLSITQKRRSAIDDDMLVSDRMELIELYEQALADIEERSAEYRYAELLRAVCDNPTTPIMQVGKDLGILPNTAAGAMRRMRLYLQREAEYAKA